MGKNKHSIATERLLLFPFTQENLALFNSDLPAFERTYNVVYHGEELDHLLKRFLLKLEKEIANGFVDELGAVYSKDRKRLLKCADVKNYKVKEGTETVDRLAFVGCDELEHLYLPYTCPEETFDAILGGTDVIGAISFWIMPYVDDDMNDDASWLEYDDVAIDEYDVAYTKNGKRLLFARIGFTNSDYYVPEGTVTICSNAFGFCEQYVVLSVPSTVKVIGDDIFGNGGGKIVFRDEKK